VYHCRGCAGWQCLIPPQHWYVAACCSVLQRGACSVLQSRMRMMTPVWLHRNTGCSVLQGVTECCSVLQCVTVCCGVLQSVAGCHRVLQCLAVSCSVLQCLAVSCSVLQGVTVCCSVLQCPTVENAHDNIVRLHSSTSMTLSSENAISRNPQYLETHISQYKFKLNKNLTLDLYHAIPRYLNL